MLEAMIRTHYQKWLVDPVAKLIINIFTPIQLTLLGGVFGILTIPALAYHQVLLAALLLLISGYFDTLDGTLARQQNLSSELGAAFDILTDRIVEFSIILGLWCYEPAGRGLLCILMLGSILLCVTSFLLVGMFTPNQSLKSFYYSPGLIERAEAFIFFIAMATFPPYFQELSILFIILVLFTTLLRMYEFTRQMISFKHD